MTTDEQRRPGMVDEANTAYWLLQERLAGVFKSPFLMLNATLADCEKQRAALGVAAEDFERDKAILNHTIEAVLAKHGFPDTNEKVDFICKVAVGFVGGGMTQRTVPQNYWPLVACHAALVTLHHEQQKKGFVVDAAMTNLALFAQNMMNIAWKPTRMKQLEDIVAGEHALAHQQQATNRVLNEANKGLLPFAEKGAKFKPGKPKGSLSPLAAAVKKYLSKLRDASADDVWKALTKKPPKGHTFCDNKQGRYIEYDEPGKNTSYRTFQNIVSKQRPHS